MMHDFQAENDPVRLRAEVRRLAENHDQVVGWLREKEAEVERLEKLIEPTEWKGWEQIDSIYEEARLLRRERDEARAEVERLEAAFGSTTGPNPAP